MLSFLIVTVVGILLGMLNSVIRIPLNQFSSDITLVFLSVIVGSSRNDVLSILSGFFIGLCLDIISLAPIGFHALIFCITGYTASKLYTIINIGKVVLACFVGLSSTFMKYFLSSVISSIFQVGYGSAAGLFSLRFFWELLSNSIIAIIMFLLFDFFSDIFSLKRGKV